MLDYRATELQEGSFWPTKDHMLNYKPQEDSTGPAKDHMLDLRVRSLQSFGAAFDWSIEMVTCR